MPIPKEEVIRIAREAWLIGDVWSDGYKQYGLFALGTPSCAIEEALTKFAELVAAREREECAKLCENNAINLTQAAESYLDLDDISSAQMCDSKSAASITCADDIRQRSQP